MQARHTSPKNKSPREARKQSPWGSPKKAHPRARNPNLTRLSVLKSAHQSLQKLSLKQNKK